MIRQTNPRGEPIYWIGPAGDAREAGEGTDFHATEGGYVSITPLQMDLTHAQQIGAERYELDATGACGHCGTPLAGRFAAGPGGFGPRRIPVRLAGA